jgi:6-phosphogluconolactonase (cycloisomerase 2 family)
MSSYFRILLATALLTSSALTSSVVASASTAEQEKVRVRMAYVVNSGRDFNGNLGPRNISIFTVDPAGALTPFGDPVDTGLGARSITFRPDGRFAYVVAIEENVVYSYTVSDLGTLSPLGEPVSTGGQSPFGMTVAPNGRALYAANLVSGTVSVFTVDQNGVPALVGTVSTGQPNPRNVAVSPNGRFLFVGHGVPTDTVPDKLITFPINSDGTLGAAKPPVDTGGAGQGMGITPDGRFLYISCAGTNDVHGFRIGTYGDLVPVPKSPSPAPQTPENVAMAPDGRHIYVSSVASQPTPSPADDGVWTFAVNKDDGRLTRVGTRTEAGTGPVGMAPTPDGKHLYVANFFSDNISIFDIAPSSGMLTEIADSPIPSRGESPGFNAMAVLFRG